METQLFWFLFGMCFAWYISEVLNVIIGIVSSYYSLFVTKIQAQINKIRSINEECSPLIGFQYNEPEEYYDEYDEDYEDRVKDKIGFVK